MSYVLTKNKKLFSDGIVFKNAFLQAADSLLIKEVDLDLKGQLMKDLEDSLAFSVQVDEFTDVVDVSQLIVQQFTF